VSTTGWTQITVAGQNFSLSFDGQGCTSGTLVRHSDGLEARFNSRECLLHLLEGVIGRRTWQARGAEIVAELKRDCARAGAHGC
jgi:hypothetical protein